jgi:SAM-dependent methyltransferase
MEAVQYRIQEKVQGSHWWYAGRRRLLHDVLSALMKERGGAAFESACDVGCGVGTHLPVLRAFAKTITAVDTSAEALRYCREKGYDRTLLSGVENIASVEGGGRADLVLAMDVLEHLPDDLPGARALYEILKPGGFLVATVPAFPVLWGLQDEVSRHYRRYRMPDFVSLLEKTGFLVEEKYYFNSFLFPPILAARMLMRLWRPSGVQSENEINSPLANAALKKIFMAEIALLRMGLRLPFGVSAFALARKPLS